jgi:hypothetical protein
MHGLLLLRRPQLAKSRKYESTLWGIHEPCENTREYKPDAFLNLARTEAGLQYLERIIMSF